MISLNEYLKKEYGEKIYRLSFDIGCTCPNRDGTVGYGGCTFCSEGGSGEFSEKITDTAPERIEAAVQRAKGRIRDKERGHRYIAYFQAFSNTYGEPEWLERVFTAFAKREDIVALSIATRPDCLGAEVLAMLGRLQEIKPVWIELGLQTVKEETAERFHRGYRLEVFEQAYKKLGVLDIPVIVHVILGLPGEDKDDMRNTVRYLSRLKPELFGIKLSLLYVLRGTPLAGEYAAGTADLYSFSPEEYADFVKELLALLPPATVVHRMTGDAPRGGLLYPLWSADKKRMVNLLHNRVF